MAQKKKYYVVWEGRNPGVYDDWNDALEQVENFPGARYKSFSTPSAATEAFRDGMTSGDNQELGAFMLGVRKFRHESTPQSDYRSIPEIEHDAWAVDASCQGNPGKMEYQGVDLASGEKLFRIGPFYPATNNIGEFLAIVHAMALMEKRGTPHTIYSDSRTAIAWVRNRRVNTKLKRDSRNERVFELIERALIWLHTHSFRVRVVKWDTDNWGEIPADFGRK